MDEILVSIRRILAEDEGAALRSPPRGRATADVLDLTEALNDDGTVRHIAPTLAEPTRPVLPDGRIEPAPPRPEGVSSEPPRLVSDAASEAVIAAFARLAAVPRREELEALVREELRPLLQAWLDKHLPELVERLVQAEIARVVGAVRPPSPSRPA